MKTQNSQKQPNPNSASNMKSRKLARLRERLAAAWEVYRATEPLLSKGPNGRKWNKLKRQESKLESSFVVYQGRDVDAVAVAYQSGDISTGEYTYISGDERLHRADDGTYYLYREDGGREYVHKLSLVAAILWSVTRANIAGPGLRKDVLDTFRVLGKKAEPLRVLPFNERGAHLDEQRRKGGEAA